MDIPSCNAEPCAQSDWCYATLFGCHSPNTWCSAEAYAAYGASLEAGLDGNVVTAGEGGLEGPGAYTSTAQPYPMDQQGYPADPQAYPLDGQVYAGDPQAYSADALTNPYGSREYTQSLNGEGGSERGDDTWRSGSGNVGCYQGEGGYGDAQRHDEYREGGRWGGDERERYSDRDDRERYSDRDGRDRRGDRQPSSTLYMRGLPENCTNVEVSQALQGARESCLM
jgi:hypothetical protein